tara:strand:+ start:1146 stop:1577 length:432 start_codon:yes stop_codon:yes gene_type:complete
VIKFIDINRYYYFKNNKFEEITIIILFLNLFLISNKIKNYIFNNNIFVVNNFKIFKLGEKNNKNIIKYKIIKNLIYKDKYYYINLAKVKNKIYIINDNISIDFLLMYFYKIKRDNDSYVIIDYFKNKVKILKIGFSSTFKDLY